VTQITDIRRIVVTRGGVRPPEGVVMNAGSIVWAILGLILFLVMLRVFGLI